MGLEAGWNFQRKLTSEKKRALLLRAIEKPHLSIYSFFKPYGYVRTPNLKKEFPELYLELLKKKSETRQRMNTGKQNLLRGSRAERRAKKELEAQGYLVVKSGRSLGIFDLIAIGKSDILLLQIKRRKEKRGMSKYQKDIVAIKKFECPSLCKKMMWIWQERKGWEKYEF